MSIKKTKTHLKAPDGALLLIVGLQAGKHGLLIALVACTGKQDSGFHNQSDINKTLALTGYGKQVTL